jgi:hypothetical protein
VLDKHASSVPAGILVRILGDILSPAVTWLGAGAIGDVHAFAPHADMALSLEKAMSQDAAAVSSENAKVRILVDGTSALDVSCVKFNPARTAEEDAFLNVDEDVFVGETCLVALCQSFLVHVHRLAQYPSFGKALAQILISRSFSFHFIPFHLIPFTLGS